MGPESRTVELAYPVGPKQSKENLKPESIPKYAISSPARRRNFDMRVELHKAALKGDWEFAKNLLKEDVDLVRIPITEGKLTALHIASANGHANFVKELVKEMGRSDLEITNRSGFTALYFIAATGLVNIAKLMVAKNENLPKIPGEKGPLYMAVWQGRHDDMAEYLYSVSDFKCWTQQDQIKILTTSIYSGLYGLAVKIVTENETLAVAEDNDGETPLEVLASKPSAFRGNSQRGFAATVVITIYMKLKARKSPTFYAYTLLDRLWSSVINQEVDIENPQLPLHISKALFIAAESGNVDFLVELIKRYPDLVYKVNSSNDNSIFHIAVQQRHLKVFNLIYELRGVKDLMMLSLDKYDNNILHLTAKLAPQHQLNRIPGAALQMQHEVLWYKEVEKLVHPSLGDMPNKDGQKPYELFLKEHRNLMREGEKQMKQIAKSCMLAAILIATIVFTTAFTVPGGYDSSSRAPILRNRKPFVVFPICEAIATLSSLLSTLLFLLILTSHYSDADFLTTLPTLLVVGVEALFVSILAIMVAFCSFLWFYQLGSATIIVLSVCFATVPFTLSILKSHLLVTIVRCTYGSKWLFRSNNRLS